MVACGVAVDVVGFAVDVVGLAVDVVGFAVDVVGLAVDVVGFAVQLVDEARTPHSRTHARGRIQQRFRLRADARPRRTCCS